MSNRYLFCCYSYYSSRLYRESRIDSERLFKFFHGIFFVQFYSKKFLLIRFLFKFELWTAHINVSVLVGILFCCCCNLRSTVVFKFLFYPFFLLWRAIKYDKIDVLPPVRCCQISGLFVWLNAEVTPHIFLSRLNLTHRPDWLVGSYSYTIFFISFVLFSFSYSVMHWFIFGGLTGMWRHQIWWNKSQRISAVD